LFEELSISFDSRPATQVADVATDAKVIVIVVGVP
jgi:hypothetical protein